MGAGSPSALGWFKWPSILLTLVAPLLAYPYWNPPEPTMRRCGMMRTSQGDFAVYTLRSATGRVSLRFVPMNERLDNQLFSHQLPADGEFDSGAWRVAVRGGFSHHGSRFNTPSVPNECY